MEYAFQLASQELIEKGQDLKNMWAQYFLQYSGYEQPRDDSSRRFSSVSVSQIERKYLYWHGGCCGVLQRTSAKWRELFRQGDKELNECFSHPLSNKERFTDLINNKLQILATHAEEGERSASRIRRFVGFLAHSQKPLLKVGRLQLTATDIIAIIAFLSLLLNILQAVVWGD